MSKQEQEELIEKYPQGSVEREVLDYSTSQEEMPPLLMMAFRLFLALVVLIGVLSLFGSSSH